MFFFFFFFFAELYWYIIAMHVLKIYESYIPVLLQYVTGSDVMLLSITVTAIVIIHISFHMYIYILHAAWKHLVTSKQVGDEGDVWSF